MSKCCFLGGENEFNKCSGSSYAFCQTAGEIQHNSRKAVTRSLCQRRLSAEPPPAPCVFFYPPSPSCPAGRLCIRQALCGKQWDWSFVIVIIFISPPTPPLHVSCPRPPAFVFVFFFGPPPLTGKSAGFIDWIVMATWYLAIYCSLRRHSSASESRLLDICMFTWCMSGWHQRIDNLKTKVCTIEYSEP